MCDTMPYEPDLPQAQILDIVALVLRDVTLDDRRPRTDGRWVMPVAADVLNFGYWWCFYSPGYMSVHFRARDADPTTTIQTFASIERIFTHPVWIGGATPADVERNTLQAVWVALTAALQHEMAEVLDYHGRKPFLPEHTPGDRPGSFTTHPPHLRPPGEWAKALPTGR